MRKPVRDFVELASTTLPLQGLVYEFGSLQVQENPELEGLRSLLKPFKHSFVGSYGESSDFPQTIVGIGFKGATPSLDRFEAAYQQWEHRNNLICQKLAERE